jgi:hypothetical protein
VSVIEASDSTSSSGNRAMKVHSAVTVILDHESVKKWQGRKSAHKSLLLTVKFPVSLGIL